MPELPEVETIVRQLGPRLAGRAFGSPRVHRPDTLRGVTAGRLVATLRGNRIVAMRRRAKHVAIEMTSGHHLVIQLRMTGGLFVLARRLRVSERRYAVLESAIGEGERFLFRDVRRLGTVALLDGRAWRDYTARIGPEPLADDFDPPQFQERLRGTKQAVKKALMDQRRIAGVGNIYANEALFRAGIDPSRPTHRVSAEALTRLFHATRDILRDAIDAGGTTVRDYRSGTGDEGAYQHGLRVYGREGRPCVSCGTRLTTTHAIDGRATTFCWRCQGGR